MVVFIVVGLVGLLLAVSIMTDIDHVRRRLGQPYSRLDGPNVCQTPCKEMVVRDAILDSNDISPSLYEDRGLRSVSIS